MNTEEKRSRQHLMDAACIKEEKALCDFTTALKPEESGNTAQETAGTMADTVRTYESILTNSAHPPDTAMSSSTQTFSKPSLSYIALIAKVILSSPSQMLNLGSIYREMEEQFPYLRSRGPGWRNSVRHNLSVNDCFVKVSRCEDGRGHYWGVHRAHLRDFQHGNFRQYRNTRGRREKERYNSVTGCLAWMETTCFLGELCEGRSESLAWVAPQCPLQEPRRNQMSALDWTQPCYQPWSFSVDWTQSPNWMRSYFIPERLPDSYGIAIAGRGHNSQPLTSGLHCWEINDSVLKGTTELYVYDSRFTTPSVQPLRLPCCWCTSPVIKDFINPLPYKVSF